ncbi:glycoside hydrolase family 13 protein [Chengkuizengella sediminis]|uniref:glycoside hydrolase family 13 protein n=1 Tax=Chengkuizengella sediminis TaxID=1885917 RepID=UPI00138A04BF|nr:alpha-glucosidase [Chengkuizengella sediminis]NDI36180.1 alpha-glucosidase [Chengkuizengella sediminis]
MKKTWWKEAVVYQVYWRSFYDSNGDGFGDLQGLIKKLDYIENLGVDIIWLNPIYESPDVDNGYDISNYLGITPRAGSMEIWDLLLTEVHNRGMKLIMDLVVNHTSSEHPWFIESRSSLTNEKRDWYIWKDPKNGQEPNNWRSYFTPSVWEFDENTNQYYMHSFATQQPDLNWKNPNVRKVIYDMMKFWLDKGIDGFRMDVINLLAKPEHFSNVENPENIHYLGNNPGIHEYLREMNDKVLKHYDIMTVGEVPFVTPEMGKQYVAEENKELNTLFHFQVADDMPTWDTVKYKSIQKEWYVALKDSGWNSQFLNNHDHTRQVTRYGNDQKYRVESAKLFATMLHTLPGMPYIFQGEEIGMTGVNYESIEEYNDIAMMNKYKEEVNKGKDPKEVIQSLKLLSRDNSRTPVQWDDTKNAGFTDGTPWININSNYKTINVKSALKDPNSIYYYYQKLISLRKKHEIMVYGEYEDLLPEDKHLYVYTRKLENNIWMIILNHSDDHHMFQFSEPYQNKRKNLIISNYQDAEVDLENDDIDLRPHEALVYHIL